MEYEYSESEMQLNTVHKRKIADRALSLIATGILLVLIVVLITVWFLNTAPSSTANAVTVEKGSTAADVAATLHAEGVVRSESLTYAALVILGNPSSIKAGDYVFSAGLSTYEIVKTIYASTPQDALVSVTLPEGITVHEMADILAAAIADFDAARLRELGAQQEGYLWPETYFVPTDFTADDAYELLTSTAAEKQTALFTLYPSSLTHAEVVILASIVEREANTLESMRMVAGILLHRIEIGMPLQADATIEYALEEKLGELPEGQLADHLENLDSPYNTYLYPGLPPTPIGNPGEDALRAVLDPLVTENLYYITDESGVFHYAETYDEHLDNVNTYLR